MGTLQEYVEWRGDLTFSQAPFCEVDNLIFSGIAYLDFQRIVPASLSAAPVSFLAAMKKYVNRRKGELKNIGLLFSPESVALAVRAARSERFGSTYMIGYVNRVSEEAGKQFSAVTFLIGEDICFVAFRGTDDTLVGWKESLSLSFASPVPSQKEAVKYLKGVAEAFPNRRLFLGGHSKGGNLAVWAAVKCRPEVNARIELVYSNDSPGFSRDFIRGESYAVTKGRIRALVPVSSVVGMLFEHDDRYEVVQSTQTGIFQHDPLSWEVLGGHFVHLEAISEESKRIDRTFKKWMSETGAEHKKQVIETMYHILSANARTLTELNADKTKIVKAWNSFDDETKRAILRFARLVMKNSRKSRGTLASAPDRA